MNYDVFFYFANDKTKAELRIWFVMKIVFKAVLFFVFFVIANACVLGAGNVYQEIDKQLIQACKRGDAKSVELLFKKGANPNLRVISGQYKGYTALRLAKEKSYKDIAKLLKQYGAKE